MMNALIVAAASVAATLLALPRSSAADVEPLAMVVEAFEASSTAQSGEGAGRFAYYERDDAQPWQEKVKAQIGVYFDKDKYHIRLECDKHYDGETKTIIIYDGTDVMSSRFSPGISVSGCAGDVYDSNRQGEGDVVRPQLCGIRWDVSKLAQMLANPRFMRKQPGDYRWKQVDNGDFLCQSGKNSHVHQIFKQAYGHNAAAYRVFSPGRETPVTEVVATWRKDKDIWYIDSMSEEFSPSHDGKSRGFRWELTYDRFEVNASVPGELFRMDALEMPGATRITDRRRAAAERFHYVPVEDKVMESTIDGLVAQLKRLPTERPRRQKPETPSAYRWVAFACVNVTIAALIIYLVWRRRRATT